MSESAHLERQYNEITNNKITISFFTYQKVEVHPKTYYIL